MIAAPAGSGETVDRAFGWLSIIRLGLVQTALGSIVVLTTATLNRIMVVELSLAAMLPGALVALHYGIQITRPRMGYGSDVAGRRTPWIILGMAVLALGGAAAALGTIMMANHFWFGLLVSVISFTMIGLGVGAAGTSLLALLAKRTDPRRRPAAAAVVWMMMIFGFVLTTGIAGGFLDPYSPTRLLAVTTTVSAIAFFVACAAVLGIEGNATAASSRHQRDPAQTSSLPFMQALSQIWHEPKARQFTIFVFISMLAYSAQDLILEPFAGAVFGFTPGQSTRLSGVHHSGVFSGMLAVAFLGSGLRLGTLRFWAVLGCLISASALAALAIGGTQAEIWPLRLNVASLGFGNGVFAVAAIGSMMGLAGEGRKHREGTRMGLWGAAQALAFGLGGFAGTAAIDASRLLFADLARAYGTVFVLEGLLFLVSAVLALRIGQAAADRPSITRAASHMGG